MPWVMEVENNALKMIVFNWSIIMINPSGEAAIDYNNLSLYTLSLFCWNVWGGKIFMIILDMQIMIHAQIGKHDGDAFRMRW
jgi:hypothetical protein